MSCRSTLESALTWSPDGTLLAQAYYDLQHEVEPFAFVRDLSTPTLLGRVCTIVGRNLTTDEWALYLPDRPYEKFCPDV